MLSRIVENKTRKPFTEMKWVLDDQGTLFLYDFLPGLRGQLISVAGERPRPRDPKTNDRGEILRPRN